VAPMQLQLGRGPTAALLGSPSFTDLSDPYAGGSFSVELLAPGLRVVRPVFGFTFSNLPEYFHELAEGGDGVARRCGRRPTTTS
jgi:hypothetical protein